MPTHITSPMPVVRDTAPTTHLGNTVPATDHASAEDVHLTTAELARRWRCSPGSLANARTNGTSIPYLKLFSGGRVVYRLTDVLAAETAALVDPTGTAA